MASENVAVRSVDGQRQRRSNGLALAVAAVTVAMMALDLAWLGVVARGLYDAQLRDLKRSEVFWPAALLFYALYVGAIVSWAVAGAASRAHAARRGAGLGLVAYGTYELTNWAVLRDWPAMLVPVDLAWGVALTAVAALAGHSAMFRSDSPRG